ncbi:MAG: hypothetical protein Q8L47_03970 [bacterium]|nr:hypothetical protein [bacterium]
MNLNIKNLLAIIFLVFFAATLYILTLRGAPGNPDPLTIKSLMEGDTKPMELSPERGRFAHVMALGDYGTYALPQVLADFVYPDVGFYQDRYYSFFAPGVSYMAVPFYNLGKLYDLSQVFTFALVSLVSIGAMIFMFLIARQIFKLSLWASIFAPLIFAFGSSAWSYAITLYQHHFAVFFFMAGFYAAWAYGKNTKWSWVWGFVPWISYAAAFTVDYPNLLFLLPMMIYFFMQAWKLQKNNIFWRISFRSSFILVSIGFIIITAWHLNFNAINFGGWQKLSGTLTSYRKLEFTPVINEHIAATTTIYSTTTTIPNAMAPKGGTFTLVTATSTTVTSIVIATTTATTTTFITTINVTNIALKEELQKNAIGYFLETKFPFGAYILLVSSERGLFVFWPIIIFSFVGIYEAFKHHKAEVSALIGGISANMFLYFSWGDPWGGWAFGPRYMILSIAILSLFVSYSMARGGLQRRIEIFILFAYSSFISLIGALTTNAIPPMAEAIPLAADYTYFRNMSFFIEGKSGSFFYNAYANVYLSLQEYGLIIYLSLLLVVAFVLFVMPKLKHAN